MRKLLHAAGNPAPIEIDGGIDLERVARVVEAGAEILVAGNAIFGGGQPEAAARTLKEAAISAVSTRVRS